MSCVRRRRHPQLAPWLGSHGGDHITNARSSVVTLTCLERRRRGLLPALLGGLAVVRRARGRQLGEHPARTQHADKCVDRGRVHGRAKHRAAGHTALSTHLLTMCATTAARCAALHGPPTVPSTTSGAPRAAASAPVSCSQVYLRHKHQRHGCRQVHAKPDAPAQANKSWAQQTQHTALTDLSYSASTTRATTSGSSGGAEGRSPAPGRGAASAAPAPGTTPTARTATATGHMRRESRAPVAARLRVGAAQ